MPDIISQSTGKTCPTQHVIISRNKEADINNQPTNADWVHSAQNVFKSSRDNAKAGIVRVDEDLKAQQNSYDTFAEKYDEFVLQHDGYRAPVILAEEVERLIPTLKGAKILDIGAGTGLTGQRIREKGYLNIDAFDMSKKSLAISRSKGAYQNYFVSTGSPTGAELNMVLDNSYDMVVSAGTFWTTTSHPGVYMFEELARIIKPGGHILIVANTEYIEGHWQEWDVLDKLAEEGILRAHPLRVVPNYRTNASVSKATGGKPPNGAVLAYEILQ